MKPTQLFNLIVARFNAGIMRTLHVEGPPGIGKTDITDAAVRSLGGGVFVCDASNMQAEDFGLPMPNADRTAMNFIVNKRMFPFVGTDCPERGVLIIEELAQAPADVQKVLRNLIQARRLYGEQLKPGYTIVTTGNRVTDRAGANRLLSHMANALTRVELEVSLDDWTQWALKAGVKPEVIAFIRFRPNLLCEFDANRETNPTPRAWAQGVSATLGLDASTEYETIKGDVGEGAAAEFSAFLKVFRKLPNPDTVLLHPDKAEVPKDPATQYAIVGALVHRTSKDNFGRAMKYIERLPAEFSVLFVRDVIAKCPQVQESAEFIAWASGPGAKLLM